MIIKAGSHDREYVVCTNERVLRIFDAPTGALLQIEIAEILKDAQTIEVLEGVINVYCGRDWAGVATYTLVSPYITGNSKMITIDGIQIPESKLTEMGYVKQSPVPTWPSIDDEYFVIAVQGGVRSNKWNDDRFDNNCFDIGNVFRTMQEAENKVERVKATTRVLNKLREIEGNEHRPELHRRPYDSHQRPLAYHITYCTNDCILRIAKMRGVYSPLEWYSTNDAWQWVIDNMEQDVLTMMGVKQND